MKKQISKALIFLLLIQLIAPSFLNKSYAAETKKCEDNPPVCTATQPYMQSYLNFQQEMIGLIGGNKSKTVEQSVAEGKGGLFTSELLKLKGYENFDQSLAGQTLRIFDITSSRSAVALLTAIFLFELAAIGALADNTIGLTILFQDRPIVRDWAKLLDIERSLSDATYALGFAGDIGRKAQNYAAIESVLRKYEGEGLFESGSTFGSDKYTDIIRQLAELNSAVKWGLAYDSTTLIKLYNGTHQLKVTEKWREKWKEEYKCTRRGFGFKCNTTWASLKKNLKILTNNTNKTGKSSIKQIKQSYTELKTALGNWAAVKNNIQGKSTDQNFSEKEKAILRSRYGLDTGRITKGDGTSILSLNSNLKSQWNKLSKGVKTATSSFVGTIGEYKKIYQESKEAVKDMQNSLSGDVYIGNRILSLFGFNTRTGRKSEYTKTELSIELSSILKVINDSHMNSSRVVNVSNNIDLSKDYVILYDQINELIKEIGDNNGGLRLSLKNLCEKQCSNKGSDCCYAK